MNPSPFMISAVLHLAVASAIWCFTGNNRPPAPPEQVVYVDLEAAVVAPAPMVPEMRQPAVPRETPEAPEPEPEPPAIQPEDAPAGPVETAQAPQHPEQPPVAPEISQAFARASYVQQMMYNTRRYQEVAGMAVRKIIEGKLPSEERRRLSGQSVRVVAEYGDDPARPSITVNSESEELRSLLEDREAWTRVPTPRECSVQYRKVAFVVSLERGAIRVGLSPQ